MNTTKNKWLLRVGLPMAGIIVALLCGKTLGGAVAMVMLTVLLMVLIIASPFQFLGIIFFPILGLYGLKFANKNESPIDLSDSDTQLFLCLGVLAALVIVGLLSLHI